MTDIGVFDPCTGRTDSRPLSRWAGCFPSDFFKRESGPFRHSGKRPIKDGKRPIKAKGPCRRRAKAGRFGSLAFTIENRHFGGECSCILAGKARKCDRFWMFARVPNPGKQSIWRQFPPSARQQSTKKTAKSSR